jgi:hypothetical protein
MGVGTYIPCGSAPKRLTARSRYGPSVVAHTTVMWCCSLCTSADHRVAPALVAEEAVRWVESCRVAFLVVWFCWGLGPS